MLRRRPARGVAAGLLATGFRVPRGGVLLSLGPVADKYWFADEARAIAEELKLPVFATPGTAEMLLRLACLAPWLSKSAGGSARWR